MSMKANNMSTMNADVSFELVGLAADACFEVLGVFELVVPAAADACVEVPGISVLARHVGARLLELPGISACVELLGVFEVVARAAVRDARRSKTV